MNNLQRVTVPHNKLQLPQQRQVEESTHTRPTGIPDARSLSDIDDRVFKFDHCYRADGDALDEDRVSVLLCGGPNWFSGSRVYHSLEGCTQYNFTVNTYFHVLGHYERQSRAKFECGDHDESKQTFCQRCPPPKEPMNDTITQGPWGGDDGICKTRIESRGCPAPFILDTSCSFTDSAVRCGEDGHGLVAEGWSSFPSFLESCDSEDIHWRFFQNDEGFRANFQFPIDDEQFITCSKFDRDGACPGFCQLLESASLSSKQIEGRLTFQDAEEDAPVALDNEMNEMTMQTHGRGLQVPVVLSVVLLGVLTLGLVGMAKFSSWNRQKDMPFSRSLPVPACEYQMVDQGKLDATISEI
eukprot:Nitzschia sp. Nitz4//scaffold104_size75438//30936//32000//NITZ4_005656-RA/size75438-processed-gene-0.60-mRNA-1//1//CDS//3329532386//1780//frame0